MIETEKLQEALFFGCCVPARMITILAAWVYSSWLAIPLVIFYITAAMGSMICSISNRQFGFLGQNRWWFSSIHSVNYFFFVVFMVAQFSTAWGMLLFDLIFGVVCYFCMKKEVEIEIHDPVRNFGKSDLTKNEREDEQISEIEKSMKNPFTILLSNSNHQRQITDDISEI